MLTYFATPVRTLILAAALAFAAQAADARATGPDSPQTTATARSTARSKADSKTDTDTADRDGIPLGGVLIIVGIVGVVIILAWVCSRMGDSR